jgi:hypothetical protein
MLVDEFAVLNQALSASAVRQYFLTISAFVRAGN